MRRGEVDVGVPVSHTVSQRLGRPRVLPESFINDETRFRTLLNSDV